MEVENINSSSTIISSCNKDGGKDDDDDDDDVPLPGFRFHPTEQELVGFYLKRKVEKRPISIELIKQADIYKYDPWDLPKTSNNAGEKEWYFFCQRGRKYRNSIRPNRVTGSGFWKATGIDRPIYDDSSCSGGCIIGLKKSLVYYRGSAGRGTKTDWMMHEFRLPDKHKPTKHHHLHHFHANPVPAIIPAAQEAEIWTLCRILKRSVTYKKCNNTHWRSESSSKMTTDDSTTFNSKTTCSTSTNSNNSSSITSSDHNLNNRATLPPNLGNSSSSSYNISFGNNNNNNNSIIKPTSSIITMPPPHHRQPIINTQTQTQTHVYWTKPEPYYYSCLQPQTHQIPISIHNHNEMIMPFVAATAAATAPSLVCEFLRRGTDDWEDLRSLVGVGALDCAPATLDSLNNNNKTS